jgi:formate dehydrogenase
VEINPHDAGPLGIASGDTVRVTSPTASVELQALVTDATRPGVIVVAHGWGSRVFDPRGGAEPAAFGVNRNALVNGTDLDPLSQVSPLNSTCVRVDRVTVKATEPERDEVLQPS